MEDHAHFLFRSGPPGLPTLMRRLLTGYAVSYNRRHRRHGQLFQNRYKSIICQEEAYLQELVRYIHLNPLRAKIVADLNELDSYPYCGHSVLMGKRKAEWLDVAYVLRYFGKRIGAARKKYRAYVEEGIAMGRRPELVGGGLLRSLGGWDELRRLRRIGQDRVKSDQRILGESDFVRDVLSESAENFTRRYKRRSQGYNFEKVVARVSSLLQLEKDYITGRGRQRDRVRARDLVCYWSTNELGISMAELAEKFGLTLAAVSYAVKRGEEVADEGGYRLDNRVI
jgi:putative transposase